MVWVRLGLGVRVRVGVTIRVRVRVRAGVSALYDVAFPYFVGPNVSKQSSRSALGVPGETGMLARNHTNWHAIDKL